MGYYTAVRGQIDITPPIPWGRVRGCAFLPKKFGGDDLKEVELVVSEEQQDTDDGTLIVRAADAVVARYEGDARNYNVVAHMQELIDQFPSHEFTGRFDCEGEETGDLWRLEIHSRKAVKVQPRIVWPDGTETRPR
jgi:hypothetical protein